LLHRKKRVKSLAYNRIMIERLCGFEVDDQIELAWRLHGQVDRSTRLDNPHPAKVGRDRLN
jgi:hypothetical protein